MIRANLTKPVPNAHKARMTRGRTTTPTGLVLMLGAIPLAGCISVEAPTEPIVIELNINIRSETIVLLAEDAGNALDENADIF